MIDDFFGKVLVYILKSKDEAFRKFKEWKTLVEVRTSKMVKKFRMDNSWEFVKYEFEKFCQKKGILRHKAVSYTPQQNGHTERMNKTILERVRCILVSKNLPNKF